MSALQILVTIIFPPLAVLLEFGLGKQFLINVVLTALGYIPGLIHAFIIQNK
jgi:uncharacterized membrane protein YqaE (UPF0057 family)